MKNNIKTWQIIMFLVLLMVLLDFVLRKIHPKIYYVDELPMNYNGMTLPPVGIFIKKEHRQNHHLLNHELVHWYQFQRDGIFKFVFLYIYYNIRYSYDGNPYELEARYEENEPCRHDYTECVRNGTAKTIHNPTFRL